MTRVYVHPLPVRIWHWINAVGFIALIVTGLQIRYVGSRRCLSGPLSTCTMDRLRADRRTSSSGWLFYLFSDKITVYHPELARPSISARASAARVLRLRHLQGRSQSAPRERLPQVQCAAEHDLPDLMLLLVPLQFYTGVVLWDLERFAGRCELLGGVRVVDTVHVVLFIFFVSSSSCTSTWRRSAGRRRALQGDVTGYEEVDDAPDAAAQPATPSRSALFRSRLLTDAIPPQSEERSFAAEAGHSPEVSQSSTMPAGSSSSAAVRFRIRGCRTSSSAPGNWRAACRFPRRFGDVPGVALERLEHEQPSRCSPPTSRARPS